MIPLPAFCMPWHASMSNAFQEILVNPLRELSSIALTPWDENPELPVSYFEQDPNRPLIFCQLPPPRELLQNEKARIIWLPMWDNVARWPLSFWRNLPSHLRIVAYSDPVLRLAKRFGVPTLRVRFFLDPAKHSICQKDEPSLLYWNRVGLYSLKALQRVCADLKVRRLIHILRPDPGYERPGLALPNMIGQTEVRTIRSFLPEAEHKRLLATCQMCLAPRPREGVGLAALQSMVRGACVLAYDGPATNEYIVHGQSGYLFRAYPRIVHKWRKSVGKRVHRWSRSQGTYHYHMVNAGQVGSGLAKVDPHLLGRMARSEQERGHAQWQRGLDAYADFLMNW